MHTYKHIDENLRLINMNGRSGGYSYIYIYIYSFLWRIVVYIYVCVCVISFAESCNTYVYTYNTFIDCALPFPAMTKFSFPY